MKKYLLILFTGLHCALQSQSFTKQTGLTILQASSDSRNLVLADFDNNSYPDLHFSNRGSTPHEFSYNFRGVFYTPSNSALQNISGTPGGVFLGDYNNDCYPDAFYVRGGGGSGSSNGASSLYENNKDGSFTIVSNSGATTVVRSSSSASWVDFNKDGFLDLYVSNTGNEKNELYQNSGNGTFSQVLISSMVMYGTNTKTPAWCDYDNDGDVDLFLPNTSGNNELYRNDDTAFYRITSGAIVSDGGSSMSASWGDYNSDGFMDLFVANTSNENNFLYQNQGNGNFLKITAGPVVNETGKSTSSCWFDFDNDGDLDLVVGNADGSTTSNNRKNYLYQNHGNGSFSKITSGSLVTDKSYNTAVAAGDVNKDGYLDLALAVRNGTNELYLNDGGGNNYINLNLLGDNSLAIAYNAKVKVKCQFDGINSRWEYRRVWCNTGKKGQSSAAVHLGLGSATTIDSLEIKWLGGKKCVFTNLPANGFYNLAPDSCKMDSILGSSFGDTSRYFTASFTDSSTGPVQKYHWDFGDGDSANIASPTHVYSTPGTYTVCLSTFDDYCKWDSVCKVITICPDTSRPGFINTNLGRQVSFTDTSVTTAYDYLWDFGDNSTSTGVNPVHTFSQAGTYNVCLTLTDSCRTKPVCRSITVCNDTLIANYGSSHKGLQVSFSDSSVNASTVSWDFGDGSSSTQLNPTHIYAQPGYYFVCMTVQDICTSTTYCDTIEVCLDTAKAAFNYTANNLLYRFSDTSSFASSYFWDFGDGNFSTQKDPVHIFQNFGTYRVCLTVTNDCYSDSICQNIIVCNLQAQADFSFQNSIAPLAVQFTDQSTDANSYYWDFGDGSFSTNQNPLKVFSNSSIFNVCLTVTDSCGQQDITCKTVDLTGVGIEEWARINSIEVYPNPTAGQLFIERSSETTQQVDLEIFDYTGKSVLRSSLQEDDNRELVDLSKLRSGVYLLHIKMGKALKTLKITKL